MKSIITLVFALCCTAPILLAQRGLASGEKDSLWGVWSNHTEEDTTRLKAIQRIAWHGYLFSQPDSAFYFAQLHYDFAEEKEMRKQMSSALNIQATALNFQGDFENALEYYGRSLQIGIEIGDRQGVGVCLNNMGNIYKNQGHYAKAIDCFFESLTIREEVGDTHGMASSLGNIANLYSAQGDNDKALEYFARCLTTMKELGNKQGIAGTMNNMALIYQDLGDHQRALDYFNQSLQMREEMGDLRGISDSHTNRGNIFFSQGDYTAARASHAKSLALRETSGDRKGVASSLHNLGKIEAAQGRHAEALAYGNRALLLAEQVGDVVVIGDVSGLLYRSYKASGRSKQALEMHERHVAMLDSVFREQNQRELLRQQFRYDYDKREAELKAEQDRKDALAREKLLRQRSQRNMMGLGFFALVFVGGGAGIFRYHRKKAEFRYRSAVSELKAVKAQINPHFFFNALNSVVNMISSNRTSEAEDYLVRYSKLMRHILKGSARDLISLDDEVKVITNYLELEQIRLKQRFSFSVQLADDLNPHDTFIPAMLIQPLVENAIWHGLTPLDEGGKVRVRFRRDRTYLVVEVEDNGVGRGRSAPSSDDGPRGSALTSERIALYNQRYRTKGELAYEDLPHGLRCTVRIALITE